MIRTRTRIASLAAAGVLATTTGTVALAAPADAQQAVHACGNHALIVSAGGEQGATGHADFVLRFRNKTAHSCSLHGYPGLDALNKFGHVIKHAKRTLNGFTGGSRHGVQTIVIAPGHYASADVEWHNFNFHTGKSCRASASVAATPANTSDTVYLNRSVTVCGLEVHPTVAGTSGDS